jgi:hypothetical protein
MASSFLPDAGAKPADTAVILKALEPLWEKAPGGAAAADTFLKSGVDLGPIKAMLGALGVCCFTQSHRHALVQQFHTHTLSPPGIALACHCL